MFFTTTCHSAAKSRAGSVCEIINNNQFQQLSQILIESRHLLLGRELGSHALDEYISTKAVHWNYGENIEWPL